MKSIKTRLLLWLMASITVLTGLCGAWSYQHESRLAEQNYQDLRHALQQRLALSLPHSVWQLDETAMRQILDAELGWPAIHAIRLHDDANLNVGRIRDERNMLRDMAPSERPTADDLLTLPIVYQGKETLGVATVYLSRQALRDRQQQQVLEILLLIAVLNGGVCLLMAINLQRLVWQPLHQLLEAMESSANDSVPAGNSASEWTPARQRLQQLRQQLVTAQTRATEAETAAQLAHEQVEHSEQTLRHTRQALLATQQLAALGGLVAGVTHEISQPVGLMLTTASDLASTTSRISEKLNTRAMSKGEWQTYLEAAQHYEERLLAQAGSASKLIQSFKQIALDQSQPVRRDFQLNRYLHSIITSLQPTLRHTTVKVQIQCEDDLILDSYPGTFAQVMINLLLHVVQAGLAEQPAGEIHIDAQRNGQQQLLLTLRDNGLGLSPEQLKHVFEPSWQTETAQPGHVLALNVIETLVRQQLGGTLEVSSAPGKGTQFNLLLPFMAPGLHTR